MAQSAPSRFDRLSAPAFSPQGAFVASAVGARSAAPGIELTLLAALSFRPRGNAALFDVADRSNLTSLSVHNVHDGLMALVYGEGRSICGGMICACDAEYLEGRDTSDKRWRRRNSPSRARFRYLGTSVAISAGDRAL